MRQSFFVKNVISRYKRIVTIKNFSGVQKPYRMAKSPYIIKTSGNPGGFPDKNNEKPAQQGLASRRYA